MERSYLRYGYLVAAVVIAMAVIPAAGCRTLLTAVAYMTKGTDVPPEFPGLKGKKVVVVCHPLVSLQYRSASAAKDLAQQMTLLLQKRVPKIKMIDQQKVAAREDENPNEDYVDIGRALDAEMVVGVDLTGFNLNEGPSLYRGRASVTVKVFDLSKEKNGQVVFEKNIPQAIYPPNVPIQAFEKAETDFRKEFIQVLADQLARHFYDHDPHADLAQDVDAGLH